VTKTDDMNQVNHSCEPNICFDLNGDRASWHVRALRDIQTDEACKFKNAPYAFNKLKRVTSNLFLPKHRMGNGPALQMPL
jgi:hypothetical protein